MRADPLVIGLDLGTGGARVVVVNAAGKILVTTQAEITRTPQQISLAKQGLHEQNPESWWTAACTAIGSAMQQISGGADARRTLRAICVDGTSGTVVGVDRTGRATTPALMYNDARATSEAVELDSLVREDAETALPGITASFGIAKMLWIERNLAGEAAATHCFAHQADFIAGRMTGQVGVTDYSNALKSGFDLCKESWAGFIEEYPQLRSRMPRVVAPGEVLGRISSENANQLGLPDGLVVIAGMTDGTAAFLASGASSVGDDNTTLGTTLVFKRLAGHHVKDPAGLIYCHKLPGGWWLPGAASNVGADWIARNFSGEDLAQLDADAASLLPTEHLAYPLKMKGERFPLDSRDIEGFCEPEASGPGVRYAACLQGTAFVERLGYEVLNRAIGGAGPARSGDVYATGGGSQSDVWMQLRADVSGRTFRRPSCPESAFGSAILAAASILHEDLGRCSRAMIRIARSFHPDAARHAACEEFYQRFLSLLEQRGFLSR